MWGLELNLSFHLLGKPQAEIFPSPAHPCGLELPPSLPPVKSQPHAFQEGLDADRVTETLSSLLSGSTSLLSKPCHSLLSSLLCCPWPGLGIWPRWWVPSLG